MPLSRKNPRACAPAGRRGVCPCILLTGGFYEILRAIVQFRSSREAFAMACNPEVLKHVPLFALLDEEETAVLAGQVRLKTFAPRQRIYKIGDSSGQAYVVVSGRVRVSTVDQDQQEVVVDEPSHGEFFGFASMLEQTPHQTDAEAIDEVVCLEVDRKDIAVLLQRKPLAGMDMLTVLGRQFHASQQLVRLRANRHPNEIIEKNATFGERIADVVAGFGGSWTFIITFSIALAVYMVVDQALDKRAWDPYPYILLNLFLSMLAAVQAPIIMMSQNRQDTKDRLRGELDYDVNRRAEAEIQGLARKLNMLGEKIADVEDMLREKLRQG
jgi:CRP/FNR family cyclic AMP-dependent transcriptional regulator